MRKGADETLLALHRGAWRADTPPLEVSLGELVEVMPVLIRAGSVGLVWPRLRHRAEEYGAVGVGLEEAFRSQVAHNALVKGEIARVVLRLREAGVEPVLIKGYAVARLYPAGLIRTAGDIDLVVPDGDYVAAQEALADQRLSFHGDVDRIRAYAAEARTPVNPDHSVGVDLHSFSKWSEVDDEGFFADARVVQLDGAEIRVPRVEDHLRALCLHFLRHGAVRPLRLCDIALLLENRPSDFSWDRCLRGTEREIEQIIVTIQLARELLGACLETLPTHVREHRLPSWLVPAVIRQWEESPTIPGPVLPEILANPKGIVRTFTRRWPDPITATLRIGAPFNNFPRGPIVLAAYLKRLGYYMVMALPSQVRDRRERHPRGGQGDHDHFARDR